MGPRATKLERMRYKVHHRIAPVIMNDIFKKKNMSYNTRYYPDSQTRNIKFVHYRSILYMANPFKFFKGCFPQILFGPYLNTLSHTIQNISAYLKPTLNSGNQRIAHAVCINYTCQTRVL